MGHAHEKARAAGHHEVGTEHLLLGILQEEDGAGARVLRSFGIDQLRVFEEMARLKGWARPRWLRRSPLPHRPCGRFGSARGR